MGSHELLELNPTYVMMIAQMYTCAMYSLLDPWGRFPIASTKQVIRVPRYTHSKMTESFCPGAKSKAMLDSDIVRIWKTKKKLPCAVNEKSGST
jgi:hypothetical protein